MAGFIKLHRNILQWEWYTDIPVRILFEHCLLKANHEAKRWQGIIIERGSFATSFKLLAQETGLTIKQVRTALNKLEQTGETAHEGHSSYSVITVKNWDLYQAEGKQRANEGQAKGMQCGLKTASKGQGSDLINTPILDQPEKYEGQAKGMQCGENGAANKNKEERIVERECARARDKRYIENDPYLDGNVQKFIGAWLSEVKKPCRLSPDERLKLWNIINDLLIQGLTIDEICSAACENFKKINSRNDFGINWLLKDDNFYSIINGEWQKKPPPKETAEAKPQKTPQKQAVDWETALKQTEDYDEKKQFLTPPELARQKAVIQQIKDGLNRRKEFL